MSPADQNIAAQEALDRIVERLRKLGAYRKRVRLASGLGMLLGALLGAALICLCLDILFFLSAPARQVLLIICALGLLFILMGFVLIPLVKGPSRVKLARLADAHYPQLRNGFVTAVQLWRIRKKNIEGYSTQFIDAAVMAVERRSRDLDLRVVVDRSRIKRFLRLGPCLLGLAAILFLLLPTPFRTSAYRLSHPRTTFQRPPRTQLVVTPGDIQVTRHSDVLVRAQIQGKIPQEVRIAWKEGEARWREEECQRKEGREFGHVFADLKRNILYRVTAGDAQSPRYRITVIDRPRVVKLRLRYEYPAYTRQEPRVIEEDGNISAVVGTVVGLEVEANRALAEAWLSLDEDGKLDLSMSGRRAEGRIVVKKSGTYAIHLMDEIGNANQDPIRYRIEAVADESPMVQVTFPAENVDMGEEMKLPLSFVAQDDFGISRAVLVHQTIREGEEFAEQQTALALPGRDATRAEIDHLWDLASLDLIPEDLVAYRVVVWDNDRISGPKKAETQIYTVRFPSIHEILAQVQEEQSLQIEDLEEMLEEERALKEKLDQIRRELENEEQMSWEQKKDVEMVLERQQEIAEQLAEIAEQMDQTLQKAQEKRVAGDQIMEKMEQIRELMEEVATPEMRQALENLQKALQELDPELVKQQLDQFNLTQEDLLKRLERTLSILKRLQAEQQLDALVKKTEDMLNRQEGIMEEAEEMDPPSPKDLEDLAGKQEKLGEESEALPDEMRELSELMDQFPEMPADELNQMGERLEASELAQQMDQAAKQLSAGRRQKARKNQKQAAKTLSQLNKDLQMLQGQMSGRMNKEITEAIKGSVKDLLAISQEQELHRSRVQELDRESPNFGNLAEGQLSLMEVTARVANDVYSVAQKTFFISPEVGKALGNAQAQMGKALNGLEQRNASGAAHAEKASMVALNEAAQQLLMSLNAMGSCASSGGMEAMMQQLQGMSEGQMSINQQTMGMGQQGQYTMEQRAQMARLAADQEAIRRGMEDVLKEFGNRSEILGRLDNLGEEMKKVVDDLAQRKVDQRTIDRQQRILSRMLDAQKSLRRRDYTRRRRSRPGQVVVRQDPGELPESLSRRDDELRRDLLRALSEDYPRAYKDLIRAYFQALSRTEEQ